MKRWSCSRYTCSSRPVSCAYATNASTEIGCGPLGPTWRRSFKKQNALHTQYRSGKRTGAGSSSFFSGWVAETVVIFWLPLARNAALNFSLSASLFVAGFFACVHFRKLASFFPLPRPPFHGTHRARWQLGIRIHGNLGCPKAP
jgi:hypothetical protein